MTYSHPSVEDRYNRFKEWCWTRQSEGRPYLLSTDTEAFEQLDPIAEKYGDALSSFDRAAAEVGLKLKQPAQRVDVDDDFRSTVRNISSAELLKRINTDPAFKAKFDALAVEDAAPRSADAEQDYSLTAAQYNSLPAEIVQRKYRADAGFRRAVDKLFSNNSVRSTNIR